MKREFNVVVEVSKWVTIQVEAENDVEAEALAEYEAGNEWDSIDNKWSIYSVEEAN